MSADALRERLQTSLGAAYTLTRELGGGGMSRVFVARDVTLDRDVVVKVLAPELAAGLSVERFAREIRLAASLQQANIVPVHASGTFEGPDGVLPYYTMPFVEGESLRHRLARGPLAIAEVVAVLRDVAKALAYAHTRDIVHRDIKPDNVLLSGGTAVVTDFGIAKALRVARTSPGTDEATPGTITALTDIGSAIGTPAYMAPEQLAGDPSVDRRADVYAFGCLAYELLTSAPPFQGLSSQRLLVAHLTERPVPVESLRSETPPALAALVAQCLEKDPAARPASAAGVLTALEAIGTPGTAGGTGAMADLPFGGAAGFRRALLVYSLVFIVVAALTKLAITGIGLPDWVLPGALLATGLGLPLLLFMGYTQRVVQRAAPRAAADMPAGTHTVNDGTLARLALKASPHLSWWRATRWGALTLGGFVGIVALFMTLRAFGVGPFATLFAAGTMRENDVLVVADFASGNDSTLGRTIAQGVKTDLRQSRAIRVLDDAAVARTLALMRRPGSGLMLPVAREVAERAGAPTVVDGTITPLGSGFVVSLRLVTADSGHEVVSYRDAVDAPSELIDAVGGLTRKLRAHIGESLRDVQQSPRLDQVSTTSLEALRRYTEANDAFYRDYDVKRFMALAREAIALDSTFAIAYRQLSSVLYESGQNREALQLLTRAYALRDRLPDIDRYGVEASYALRGPREALDTSKVRAARVLVVTDPRRDVGSLNALASYYHYTGRYAVAESVYRVAIAADTTAVIPIFNLLNVAIAHGQYAEVESLIAISDRRFPGDVYALYARATLLNSRGLVDSAAQLYGGMRAGSNDPFRDAVIHCNAASNAQAGGRLLAYERAARACATARLAQGARSAPVTAAIDRAQLLAMIGDRTRARALLDSLAAQRSLAALDSLDRPDAGLAIAAALAGDLGGARVALMRAEAVRSEQELYYAYLLRTARAYVAIAERRWDVAIREARLAGMGLCTTCGELPLGLAYDGNGQADSAIAAYERSLVPLGLDGPKVLTLRRLGELYEAKGDFANAIDRYQRFVKLWEHADPVLQPQVADVRARLTGLQAKEARAR